MCLGTRLKYFINLMFNINLFNNMAENIGKKLRKKRRG